MAIEEPRSKTHKRRRTPRTPPARQAREGCAGCGSAALPKFATLLSAAELKTQGEKAGLRSPSRRFLALWHRIIVKPSPLPLKDSASAILSRRTLKFTTTREPPNNAVWKIVDSELTNDIFSHSNSLDVEVWLNCIRRKTENALKDRRNTTAPSIGEGNILLE